MTLAPDILAYTQSEKVKAGLIWLSQALLQFDDKTPSRSSAAEKLALSILTMIRDEVQLGWRLSGEEAWLQAEAHLQRAAAMIHSGVAHDAPWHLTLALRKVTALGQATHRRLERWQPVDPGDGSG
jgi:hypothetical protein